MYFHLSYSYNIKVLPFPLKNIFFHNCTIQKGHHFRLISEQYSPSSLFFMVSLHIFMAWTKGNCFNDGIRNTHYGYFSVYISSFLPNASSSPVYPKNEIFEVNQVEMQMPWEKIVVFCHLHNYAISVWNDLNEILKGRCMYFIWSKILLKWMMEKN